MKVTAETVEGLVNALLLKNYDSPTKVAEFHREWWRMCCSDRKFVAIAAPRGHSKSTSITLAYTLSCLLFRERQFILLVSDTEAQSSFFLNNIKKELDSNKDLRDFFKVQEFVKDSETDFIVKFEDNYQARILAKGSEQKLRGINWDNKRPDLIIIDDCENDEIVMNKDRREKFRRWFTGALLPCRSSTGIIRYVGTILHMDSMLERLMPKEWDKTSVVEPLKITSNPKNHWYAAKYKAHDPKFEHVLWPEAKPAEWLKHERESTYLSQGLGDVYSQEYLNIPIDEDNSYFKKLDFGLMKKEDRAKKLHYYLSCDLAVSTKTKADFSVFLIGGMDSEGKLYIVDVIKERIDSLDIVDRLLALNIKYKPMFCVFEKGAITSSILPYLNRAMVEQNNYIMINTIQPTVDKITRAQAIRARMRAGQVKFDKECDWWGDLELECLRFPRDAHDDQVDALSLLGLALNRFIEAPTPVEEAEEEYAEQMQQSGLFEEGRSEVCGY